MAKQTKNTATNAKEKLHAAKRALKKGPHGQIVQTDGSTQAVPNPHLPTSGGVNQ
jgi:hypothetical protein